MIWKLGAWAGWVCGAGLAALAVAGRYTGDPEIWVRDQSHAASSVLLMAAVVIGLGCLWGVLGLLSRRP